MPKCYKCNLDIKTDIRKCPLCGNLLESKKEGINVFPTIPMFYTKHRLLMNTLLFISIFGSITSTIVNIFINKKMSWAWFVIVGILSFWSTVLTAIKRRKYFMHMLFNELNIVIIAALIWDFLTGWHEWSIIYVLPFVCVAYILTNIIMRIFFNLYIKDHMIHIYITCLIGIVPLILILCNVLPIIWPSMISVITSIFSATIVAVFNRRQLKNELVKNFHI